MPDERPNSGRPLRVLVVDDEALGRLRVNDLLAREKGIILVGEAADGIEAVQAIRALNPDLVFLDIQMPGKSGLEVVREIGPARMPATIFVTAYDQFALQAFDVAALDYLVKPFDDERFEQALDRARHMIALEGMGRLRERLLKVLEESDIPPAAPASSGLPETTAFWERIPVETRGKVRFVPTADIEYITATGPYAELHVAGHAFLIREPMHTIEEHLDPARFLRVHRSAIVRLDLVETLYRHGGGGYQLQLRGGVRLRVSRSRREALERRLGLLF